MKIETGKLIGAALDWAVSQCEGRGCLPATAVWDRAHFKPSTDWAQGGPIIEREEINLEMPREGLWTAQMFAKPYNRRVTHTASAETPLIAAMRCYVASKLGDEIEVPDELTTMTKEAV